MQLSSLPSSLLHWCNVSEPALSTRKGEVVLLVLTTSRNIAEANAKKISKILMIMCPMILFPDQSLRRDPQISPQQWPWLDEGGAGAE